VIVGYFWGRYTHLVCHSRRQGGYLKTRGNFESSPTWFCWPQSPYTSFLGPSTRLTSFDHKDFSFFLLVREDFFFSYKCPKFPLFTWSCDVFGFKEPHCRSRPHIFFLFLPNYFFSSSCPGDHDQHDHRKLSSVKRSRTLWRYDGNYGTTVCRWWPCDRSPFFYFEQ